MGAMRVWGVTATEAWEPRGCGGNKQAYPTGEVQGGGGEHPRMHPGRCSVQRGGGGVGRASQHSPGGGHEGVGGNKQAYQ